MGLTPVKRTGLLIGDTIARKWHRACYDGALERTSQRKGLLMPDASGSLPNKSLILNPFLPEVLEALPKPEPVWHTVPARDRTDGIKWSYERWKPSVYTHLEPLHGHRGGQLPDGRFAIIRPPLVERIKRYRRALGIVYEFSAWEDLLPLAVHRRQVTNMGGVLEIDHPLYLLACKSGCFYRPVELRHLAERMPPRSNIRGMLLYLAAVRLKQVFSPRGSVPD